MATKEQRQLAGGYARRMLEVAKLAAEMHDIKTKYEAKFKEPIDDQVSHAALAMKLRSMGLYAAAGAAERVAEGVTDAPENVVVTADGCGGPTVGPAATRATEPSS